MASGENCSVGIKMHAGLAEWWGNISLRTKITAVTVIVMTFGLVLAGIGVTSTLRSYLVHDANEQLSRTLALVSPRTVETDEASVATQYAFAHFSSTGVLIQANPQWSQNAPNFGVPEVLAVKTMAPGGQALTARNAANAPAFQLAAKRLPDQSVVVLALPLSGTNRLIAQLFTLFFLFSMLVIVLGAILTRVLVDSTFKPLRQVESTAAAIASGDFGQRLGNATPNTEVGRLNRSLNRMLNQIDTAFADRARTIDQMRRFVGDASHELRTPLVSVRGYAELYRMGALQSKEDVSQAMDRIEKEAVRLGTLVSDLLALARLDEHRELKRSAVELLPLAHDAALDARALAPKRMISVIGKAPDDELHAIEVLPPVIEGAPADAFTTSNSMRLFRRRAKVVRNERITAELARQDGTGDTTLNPMVLGEEDRLRQVLTNLLGNAIRYTPDGSPIDISVYCDKSKGTAVMEVIDHGEGIPAQVRDKIFERFWRADSSRARDTGGSGLGLSIVASIVQAHDGTVGIFETPGGGATFRVVLPLFQDDAQTSAAEEVEVE